VAAKTAFSIGALWGIGTQILILRHWIAICGGITLAAACFPLQPSKWSAPNILGTFSGIAMPILCGVGCGILLYHCSNNYDGNPEDEASFTIVESRNETNHDFWVRPLLGIGKVLYSCCFHMVLPQIQFALIMSSNTTAGARTNADSSSFDYAVSNAQQETCKALKVAFCWIFPSCIAVACLGYAAYGDSVNDLLLILSLGPILGKVPTTILYVFLLITTLVQVWSFNQAACSLIEHALFFRRVAGNTRREQMKSADNSARTDVTSVVTPSFGWQQVSIASVRVSYVAGTSIVAALFPYFGALTAVTGALAGTPLFFIFPILLWSYSREKEITTRSKVEHGFLRIILHLVLIAAFLTMGLGACVASIVDLVNK
jgi:hypothetical protein